MEKKIFTIETESLGCYAECDDFEIGKFRDNATSWYISKSIYTISGEILAYSGNTDKMCYEVAHKQSGSTQ